MSELRFINANQVKQYLTMPDAIAAMRLAFADLSSGSAMVPERQPVHTAGATHYLVMPAHYPSGNITMVKSVTRRPFARFSRVLNRTSSSEIITLILRSIPRNSESARIRNTFSDGLIFSHFCSYYHFVIKRILHTITQNP